MTNINITRNGERIALRSPYSPNFPPRAKELWGRWDPLDRVWTFAARKEQLVRSRARAFRGPECAQPTPPGWAVAGGSGPGGAWAVASSPA